MPGSPTTASDAVYHLADGLGFALVGIADAQPSEHGDMVRQWIADGKHGEMAYLANHLEVRLDPCRLLEGARSVITVADAYAANADDEAGDQVDRPAGPVAPLGRVARYAWGGDYHKTIKKRLHTLADALRTDFPQADFRCVVDTAPALEREHAMRAGLGWAGKHTVLIHPRYGSYFLLGLIVTTLPLESSRDAGWPGRTVAPDDHCGTCTRCIDACPTRCIDATAERGSPRSIDASRCISYLTLEHRGPIDPSLHRAMGDWVAGCDVCQEVCPHNQGSGGGGQESGGRGEAALPLHEAYAPRAVAAGLPLLEVLGWTPEDRQRAFTGSALKRVKLDMLKRNALIALGNHLADHDAPVIRRRIEAVAADESESPLARETAGQVLRGEGPLPRASRGTLPQPLPGGGE